MTSTRAFPSLDEIINSVRVEGGEVQVNFVNDAAALVQDVHGFRFGGPTTISRQDRHLRLFLKTISTAEFLPDNTTDLELKKIAFPVDLEQLYHNLSIYMVVAFKHAKPRTKYGLKQISYGSMTQYRNSMEFWIPKVYEQLQRTPPAVGQVFAKMTDTMKYLHETQRTDSRSTGIKAPIKTHLSISELRQLIEHDMCTTWCIENAEQHHLAWCLGRVLALRPGSIGSSKFAPEAHLTWNDVKITREEDNGKFVARITIRFVKQSSDPEKAPGSYQMVRNSMKSYLQFNVRCPTNVENMIFSVPHRLLVIALRRGVLRDLTTIDELMESDARTIKSKTDRLNDSIFFRSKPRGLELDMTEPLQSHALTDYIADRGRSIGFEHPITFYSIRRRAATDLALRYGNDVAREVLNHAPDSRILERFYLDTRPGFDATAAGLNEPTSANAESKSLRDSTSLAMTKLGPEKLLRTQKASLNVLVASIVNDDPDYPEDASVEEMKNYVRRVKRIAFRILSQQQHDFQANEQTMDTHAERAAGLQASRFAERVLELAREGSRSEAASNLPEAAGEQEIDFDEEWEGFVDDDEAEPDAEEADQEATDSVRDVDVDEQDDELFVRDDSIDDEDSSSGEADAADREATPENHPELTYANLAKATMGLILNNTASTKKMWKHKDQRCPLCLADDTISQIKKDIKWPSQVALESHMASKDHSKYAKWSRKQTLKQQAASDGKWRCPYCPSSKSTGYSKLSGLQSHVDSSNAARSGDRHDELKSQDGWYDEDFKWTMSAVAQNQKDRKAKRKLVDVVGIEYAPYPALDAPIPDAQYPGLVRGSFVTSADMADLSGGTLHDMPPAPSASTLDGPLKSMIQNGLLVSAWPPSALPMPPRFDGKKLKFVKAPEKRVKKALASKRATSIAGTSNAEEDEEEE